MCILWNTSNESKWITESVFDVCTPVWRSVIKAGRLLPSAPGQACILVYSVHEGTAPGTASVGPFRPSLHHHRKDAILTCCGHLVTLWPWAITSLDFYFLTWKVVVCRWIRHFLRSFCLKFCASSGNGLSLIDHSYESVCTFFYHTCIWYAALFGMF